MKPLFLLLAVALATPASWAQRPAPIVSPVVHDDGTVTFSIHAPDAEEVLLSSQFTEGLTPFERGADGVWALTVGPVEPDIYPYHFVVDGVSVADPNNMELFPNEGFKASLVAIPGEPTSLYSPQSVPHGKVAYAFYESDRLGVTRPLVVYTPPGYEESGERYPVFYLVSGTTDTEETWFRVGRVNFLLDNLIASGEAEPMIVVMPYGNMLAGTARPSSPEAIPLYRLFSDVLMDEVIPYVDASYRTVPDRDHRAIAGFSRGGGQSLFTGFAHFDDFAWIGSYSAYLTPEAFDEHFGALAADPEATNERLGLLWLGVGDEDFLYEPAVEFMEYVDETGIAHETVVTGGGHTWMNARHYLAETLRRFFK